METTDKINKIELNKLDAEILYNALAVFKEQYSNDMEWNEDIHTTADIYFAELSVLMEKLFEMIKE